MKIKINGKEIAIRNIVEIDSQYNLPYIYEITNIFKTENGYGIEITNISDFRDHHIISDKEIKDIKLIKRNKSFRVLKSDEGYAKIVYNASKNLVDLMIVDNINDATILDITAKEEEKYLKEAREFFGLTNPRIVDIKIYDAENEEKIEQDNEFKPIIYIDVDWTLSIDYENPLIVNGVSSVDKIKELSKHFNIYVWSTGGKQYCDEIVKKLGIEKYICGTMGKPHYIIDDAEIHEWLYYGTIKPKWDEIDKYLNKHKEKYKIENNKLLLSENIITDRAYFAKQDDLIIATIGGKWFKVDTKDGSREIVKIKSERDKTVKMLFLSTDGENIRFEIYFDTRDWGISNKGEIEHYSSEIHHIGCTDTSEEESIYDEDGNIILEKLVKNCLEYASKDFITKKEILDMWNKLLNNKINLPLITIN